MVLCTPIYRSISVLLFVVLFFFFFFQAEDGIRDWSVTGVQTCALPIPLPKRHTSVNCYTHGTIIRKIHISLAVKTLVVSAMVHRFNRSNYPGY